MIVVIGIGQSLRGDDGAGITCVQTWTAAYPSTANNPQVRVELVEMPGLALLDLLEGARAALIVDAVRSGAEPGVLHLLDADDLLAFSPGSGSAHGWGVAETLQINQRLDPDSPLPELRLIGIEAGDLRVGADLSEPIIKALPAAAELIDREVQGLFR